MISHGFTFLLLDCAGRVHRHLLGLCNYSWSAQLGVERTAHGWPDCANTHSNMISIFHRF